MRILRPLRNAAVLASALMLTPADAHAGPLRWLIAGQFGRAALDACGTDIARLCPGVVPGGGRIAQCLAEHREAVSPPCRSFLQGAEDTRFAFFACSADASRLCGSVVPGGGRIVACLKENVASVSPACREGLDRASAAFDH